MTERMENALNHIKTSVDVDPWAMEEVERVFNACDDDCISRQAVIESICKQYTEHNAIVPIWLSIGDMPSVTPTERTGHWIEHPTEEDYSVCSCCGIGSRRMEHGENADGTKYIDIYSYRFCPYCGAKMVEPQESEEISDRNIKMWEEIFKAESEDRE